MLVCVTVKDVHWTVVIVVHITGMVLVEGEAFRH